MECVRKLNNRDDDDYHDMGELDIKFFFELMNANEFSQN
jgi:hypothetical protein